MNSHLGALQRRGNGTDLVGCNQMKTRKISARVACALLPLLLFGCTTFETQKVTDGAPAKGYPFVFSKPYSALVTYTDGTSSTHILSIPTLYAVDVKQSPLGTTDTSLENTDQGFAKKSTAKIDQKIPENIAAITELLKQLGVTATGAPGAPGAPTPTFVPDLALNKQIASMTLTPVN